MNEQIHAPLVAGQDHLSGMPPEILREIFKHVLEIPSTQVLPNTLIQISRELTPHASNLLLKDFTLQLECRHKRSHHFWATSLYRSSTKGRFLRSPDNRAIGGLLVRWSKFRELRQHAEMLESVDSLYIRLNWMRGLAFTILLHLDKPPTIITHTWYQPHIHPSARFRPDMRHWREPAVCSVEWIEFFIKDMLNQCTERWAGTRVFPVREDIVALMKDMSSRQPWSGRPVLLRSTDRNVTKPRFLGLAENESLIHNFFRQRWVAERFFRKRWEESYKYKTGLYKDWVVEQMEEKAEDFKRMVGEQVGGQALRKGAMRRHSI